MHNSWRKDQTPAGTRFALTSHSSSLCSWFFSCSNLYIIHLEHLLLDHSMVQCALDVYRNKDLRAWQPSATDLCVDCFVMLSFNWTSPACCPQFVYLQASGKVSDKEMARELLTIRKLFSDIQLCPKCRMPIVKTEGCNKMSCGNCGQLLCFRCGRAISGYDHFW